MTWKGGGSYSPLEITTSYVSGHSVRRVRAL